MSATMEAALQLQERLQNASAEYQKLQSELSDVVEARQKLDAQLSENELVKKVRTVGLKLNIIDKRYWLGIRPVDTK